METVELEDGTVRISVGGGGRWLAIWCGIVLTVIASLVALGYQFGVNRGYTRGYEQCVGERD